MLFILPLILTDSLTHSPTHSLIHSLIYPFIHSLIHSGLHSRAWVLAKRPKVYSFFFFPLSLHFSVH